ncbi:MAG: adenylate kinase [Spirochaetes bacterium GWF1_51_8]|nr:MAG: adenylate kinase [Spirochaetes bacterium GWF1_51_8]
MYNIVFIGPPGGGKGTQADMVCKDLNIPHISTGEIFRAMMKEGKSELADLVRSYVSKGELVPDEVVVDVLFDRISKDDCQNGYLLDGFPRSLNQAEVLDAKLKNSPLTHVILIDVDEELLFKRLTGRRTAVKSGKIYNIYFNPPKVEGKCDVSGEDLIIRDDDKPETVTNRMKVYKDQTMAAVEYYRAKKVLRVVRGEKNIDVVFAELKEVLKS